MYVGRAVKLVCRARPPATEALGSRQRTVQFGGALPRLAKMSTGPLRMREEVARLRGPASAQFYATACAMSSLSAKRGYAAVSVSIPASVTITSTASRSPVGAGVPLSPCAAPQLSLVQEPEPQPGDEAQRPFTCWRGAS